MHACVCACVCAVRARSKQLAGCVGRTRTSCDVLSQAAACGICSTVFWAVHASSMPRQGRGACYIWPMGSLRGRLWGCPAVIKLLQSCTPVVGCDACQRAWAVRVCFSHLPSCNRQPCNLHTCWPVEAAVRRPSRSCPPPHCFNCFVARVHGSGRVRAVRDLTRM